jgi:hypothetical protein
LRPTASTFPFSLNDCAIEFILAHSGIRQQASEEIPSRYCAMAGNKSLFHPLQPHPSSLADGIV